MYCISCGKPLNPGVRFCNVCGAAQSAGITPMPGQQQVPQQQFQQPYQPQQPAQQQLKYSTDPYDTPQVRALLGDSAEGYIRVFNRMALTGSTISWNWGWFFLNYFWMLTRPFDNTECQVLFRLYYVPLILIPIYLLTGDSIIFVAFLSLGLHIYTTCRFNYWKKLSIDNQLRRMGFFI